MPKEYVLKKPVIDLNRLVKICKTCIEDGNSDRKLAIETLAFFRTLVDENPNDDTAKKCMTDCMKLAQTAKVNLTKVIDLIIRIEDLQDKRSNSTNPKSNTKMINFFKELGDDKDF